MGKSKTNKKASAVHVGTLKSSKSAGAAHAAAAGGEEPRRSEKKKCKGRGRTDEEKEKIARDNAAMKSNAEASAKEAERAKKAYVKKLERESQKRSASLGGWMGPGGEGGTRKANTRKRGAKCAGP